MNCRMEVELNSMMSCSQKTCGTSVDADRFLLEPCVTERSCIWGAIKSQHDEARRQNKEVVLRVAEKIRDALLTVLSLKRVM